jgi:hypothetical protein
MVYVPFVLGVLVAGRFPWRVFLLGLATTFLFVARESLIIWWRARRRGRDAGTASRLMVIYLLLAVSFGGPLVFVDRLYGLLPLGALVLVLLVVNVEQAARQEERTVVGEMLAVVGLTVTAPAAYYVARGVWENTALWLWALSALYFVSSVFYVKLRVLTLHSRKIQERQRVRWQCGVYHSFLLVGLLVLGLSDNVSLFALIAFSPALARAGWHLLNPSHHLDLRRIGVLEIIYSLVFLIFVALGFYDG